MWIALPRSGPRMHKTSLKHLAIPEIKEAIKVNKRKSKGLKANLKSLPLAKERNYVPQKENINL